MELTILQILYIVLIIFTSIIWTLLIVVLMRVLKVLWVAVEIVEFYNKIKQILSVYAHIPEMIKEKVSDILSSKDDKKTWEEK